MSWCHRTKREVGNTREDPHPQTPPNQLKRSDLDHVDRLGEVSCHVCLKEDPADGPTICVCAAFREGVDVPGLKGAVVRDPRCAPDAFRGAAFKCIDRVRFVLCVRVLLHHDLDARPVGAGGARRQAVLVRAGGRRGPALRGGRRGNGAIGSPGTARQIAAHLLHAEGRRRAWEEVEVVADRRLELDLRSDPMRVDCRWKWLRVAGQTRVYFPFHDDGGAPTLFL